VPKPGVTPEAVATEARGLVGANAKVFSPDELSAEFVRDFQTFLTPFWLLARGLLIVAFIATASTLLLAGVKRRAEHGLLAAVGMPPGDLARMVLIEAGVFGVLGTLGGLISGLAGLATFSMASTVLTGLAIPFHPKLLPLLVYGTIATACVVAGAALPALRTARLDPITALRYE
jgi:lipoprotein-releasing system permease protein